MQRISRRMFFKGLGSGAAALLMGSRYLSSALADQGQCPQVSGKTIRWIVSAPPGGGFDIQSRLVAPFYEKRLGARIALDYVPGAGTMLGARALKDAAPNGLTMGLLDAPGLLVAALTGETEAPNPVKDFTILGRILKYQQVWAVRSGSPFKSMEDVLAEAQKRPILFGFTDVGSAPSVNIVVSTFLLGVNADFIAGYRGSREVMLALMRGEIDILTYALDLLVDEIEAGDLRPILQVSCERISPHPSLDGVPLLCGDDGMAARRAAELGKNVEEAKADAAALVGLMGGGRLVAAPLGLDAGLSRCLEESLYQAMNDPGFHAAAAAARRSVSPERADVALSELKAASERSGNFIPIIKSAIEKVRR